MLFLPGLDAVVLAELRAVAPELRGIHPVPGRDDSLAGDLAGSFAPLLRLRTAVAPFRVHSFPVARPKSLLSGEYLPQIAETMDVVRRLNPDPPRSFRIDAAGRDSAVYARFADELVRLTGLRYEPETGSCLLRVRPNPSPNPDGTGWDVLVRLSTGPLSARAWRVADHPAGANATVAAAMARLTRPKPTDRVLNLMCGSGTLLIERLLAAPARSAVGVDIDPASIDYARANLRAAGLAADARLLTADITDPGWYGSDSTRYDVVLADPPWGDKSGRRDDITRLHEVLLERASAVTAPGARLAILSPELGLMDDLLSQTADSWQLQSSTPVFHKGHHPRIYLLHKASRANRNR